MAQNPSSEYAICEAVVYDIEVSTQDCYQSRERIIDHFYCDVNVTPNHIKVVIEPYMVKLSGCDDNEGPVPEPPPTEPPPGPEPPTTEPPTGPEPPPPGPTPGTEPPLPPPPPIFKPVPDGPCAQYGSGAIMTPCGCIGGTSGKTQCIIKSPCPLDLQKMRDLFPNSTDDVRQELITLIERYSYEFGIDTGPELRHWLAQASMETGFFTNLHKVEGGRYTSLDRLLQFYSLERFGGGDPSDFLYNEEKLFNQVYTGYNGNTEPGDGFKYRGRGFFQLTGKGLYQEFQDDYNAKYDPDIDVVNNPDLIAEDSRLAIISALWYYQKKIQAKLNVTDTTSVDDIVDILNKGLKRHERDNRIEEYNKIKNIINCDE